MRTIPSEAAFYLANTGWLSRIPKAFQDEILDACLCYELDQGQAIAHGGDESGGMFGIVSGAACVYSAVGSSDGPLIHIAGAAFWFGIFPVTNGQPRMISVTAQTRCQVARMPQAALQSLLERKPEMWRWLSLLSLESARLAVQALADVLIRDNERRCAAVLLRVAGCRECGDQPASAILTQDDLAALSNLSRPTVSLVLRHLAERGLISLGYRAITLQAPAKLRHFVG